MKSGRCATLGRMKNLEMTEYQKQRLLNEANTVGIPVRFSLKSDLSYYLTFLQESNKEYTLSLGRNHKLRRKPYSESEEYDTDTSGDTTIRNDFLLPNGGGRIRGDGGNVLHQPQRVALNGVDPVGGVSTGPTNTQELRNNLNRYSALRYRQQFNL